MKRIISLMLTLAVALSLLILPAGAASTPEEALGEVNIYSGGYSMNYLAVNGRVQTQYPGRLRCKDKYYSLSAET